MKNLRLILFCLITSASCQSKLEDKNIVLINIGNYDKGRIAKLISKVNTLNPKVISLDVAFPTYDGSHDDISLPELAQVFRKCDG